MNVHGNAKPAFSTLSKEERFYDPYKANFNPPGPGNYNIPDSFQRSGPIRPSPQFKALINPQHIVTDPSIGYNLRAEKLQKSNTPGPGQYDVCSLFSNFAAID